jgi:predicted nuclease with RNAse H fold
VNILAMPHGTLFAGIDPAGASNTWMVCLAKDGDRMSVVRPAHRISLAEIVKLAEDEDIAAIAIDAQLSLSLADETGFRSSDKDLRGMLGEDQGRQEWATLVERVVGEDQLGEPLSVRDRRHWVMSVNGLMAVPIRARLLAEALSPLVPTIIETHPRANLYFGTPRELDDSLRRYKSPRATEHVPRLWRAWSERFGIEGDLGPHTDGALDAAVCATIAYMMHYQPEKLYRLRHTAPSKTGRGPFYVINPQLQNRTSARQ